MPAAQAGKLWTLDEALADTHAPLDVRRSVALIEVPFVDFAGRESLGQLVVARDLAEDVRRIFEEMFSARFPVRKMVPIVAYGWDDHASIHDDNTSAFNYRVIEGTNRLSFHALGRAIDLNPRVNPFFVDGASRPAGYAYDPAAVGAVREGDLVVRAFLERGWEWGGHWDPKQGMVDYQHFQKR